MRTPHRLLATAVLVAAISACSAAADLVGPGKGDLIFRLDAQSCSGAPPLGFQFFMDGRSQGTAILSPGGEKSFRVDAGGHTIGATVVNTSIEWETTNITVPANSSFTWTMVC